MKRKPTPLICTPGLIFQPLTGLVFDRRTYYDQERPLCFGELLSFPDFLQSPLDFRREWRLIVDRWQDVLEAKRARRRK